MDGEALAVVVVVVVAADTRLRFLAGGAMASSMSGVVCDLVFASALLSVVVDGAEYANLAMEDRVNRLGGDADPEARSNTFDVSLDTLDARMIDVGFSNSESHCTVGRKVAAVGTRGWGYALCL